MESFKSRKFLITVAVLVMSYALVFVNQLDAKTWFQFACLATGIYATGNVAQKFANQQE